MKGLVWIGLWRFGFMYGLVCDKELGLCKVWFGLWRFGFMYGSVCDKELGLWKVWFGLFLFPSSIEAVINTKN